MAKRGRPSKAELERRRLELEAQENEAQEEPELTDREQIYQKYEETNPQPETVPEETEQAAEPEEPEKPETAPVEAEEKKEEKEEVKEEPKQDDAEIARNLRAALKENRIKTKKLQDELNEYKKKPAEVREEDAEQIYDLEAELKEHKEKIKALETIESQRVEREQKQQATAAKNQLQSAIDKADKELEEEGYGGFRLLVGNVTEKLQEIVQQKLEDDADLDPNVLVKQYDNPEEWKKIYKNQVFPIARDIIVKTDKSKVLDEKKRAKEQANLITTAGKDEKPSEEKPMSPHEELRDYINVRRSNRL